MEYINYNVNLSRQRYEREYSYDNKPVLSVSYESYIVEMPKNRIIESIINRHIRQTTEDFMRYSEEVLLPQAQDTYKESLDGRFPFLKYEAILKYEITYNEKCFLSLYRDQYEFSGGAHGSTIRSSDTWNLNSGRMVTLADYFTRDFDYRTFLLDQIIMQAEKNTQVYFENYKELIVQYFNPDDYYLEKSGLTVYYQQYDIGPYSSGIITFTIPYNMLDFPPSCSL